MKSWNLESSLGQGWTVENPPHDVEDLPKPWIGHPSCFVTSYGLCSKEQLIVLKDHGFTDEIMDHIKPEFEVHEW